MTTADHINLNRPAGTYYYVSLYIIEEIDNVTAI